MGVIGLGSDWLSARIRIPSPPQKSTTFIVSSPSATFDQKTSSRGRLTTN